MERESRDDRGVFGPSVYFTEYGSDDSKHKPFMLVLLILATFGSYYVYDGPAALETQLENLLEIDSVQYNLFYTVYSVPNFVLPLFGGYLLDYIGHRLGFVLCSGLVVGGQLLFTLGLATESFPLALGGRIVYGLGGETLVVAQTVLATKWFMGKNFALVLGMILCVGRLASVANQYTQPQLNETTGSPVTGQALGTALCVLCWCCALGAAWIDRNQEATRETVDRPTVERVNLREIREFKKVFWLIVLNIFAVYICVLVFYNTLTQFFQLRFFYSKVDSGYIAGTMFILPVLLIPVFGKIVDCWGKRPWFILFSASLATIVHLGFVLVPDCQECTIGILLLAGLGLSYSIYSAVIWPCIPFTIPQNTIGTGYGVATALQNLGMGLSPILIGFFQENTRLNTGFCM